MASFTTSVLLLLAALCGGAAAELYRPSGGDSLMTYHRGAVLQGNIAVGILWYGNFTPAQKAVVSDVISSFAAAAAPSPSAAQWWSMLSKLYLSKLGKKANIALGAQVFDAKCSLGKTLTMQQVASLALKAAAGAKSAGIAVVLTAHDVAVDGFCVSSCAVHATAGKSKTPYIWVGDAATQCAGQCAWPFARPIYGPQTPPLVPPSGDVGADGVVINLAEMLAGAVTNPYGNGYFQGSPEAPLEAATACSGAFGRGSYPGYPGELLVDAGTGASYNANGGRKRKFLLPALFDPSTSTCSTLL